MGIPSGLNVGPTPAPVIRAAVRLNGLTEFRVIEFLIDTGASGTIIHPRDAILLWSGYLSYDFDNDSTLDHSGGIGGLAQHIACNATILFLREDNQIEELTQDLSIGRLVIPNPVTG